MCINKAWSANSVQSSTLNFSLCVCLTEPWGHSKNISTMFRLVVIACLVAVAVGKTIYSDCGELQRLKVKLQWKQAYGESTDREEFDIDLWREILIKHPELRAEDGMFKRVFGWNIYSPEFQAHAARVSGGFDMCITMLDEPDVFAAQIKHLNQQHIELKVDGVYFDAFLDALLDTVQSRIGLCFDQDAWKVCGRLITNGIRHNK